MQKSPLLWRNSIPNWIQVIIGIILIILTVFIYCDYRYRIDLSSPGTVYKVLGTYSLQKARKVFEERIKNKAIMWEGNLRAIRRVTNLRLGFKNISYRTYELLVECKQGYFFIIEIDTLDNPKAYMKIGDRIEVDGLLNSISDYGVIKVKAQGISVSDPFES